MSSVLLTFLGRVPKDQQGYRVTRYDFGDGQPQAAAEHLARLATMSAEEQALATSRALLERDRTEGRAKRRAVSWPTP
ncbi:MAG: hypothetical protein IPN92_07685 [Chromatiaceae bacterium]|nr:hypothetical protein [Chromatiaceae bacterium]